MVSSANSTPQLQGAARVMHNNSTIVAHARYGVVVSSHTTLRACNPPCARRKSSVLKRPVRAQFKSPFEKGSVLKVFVLKVPPKWQALVCA
jgi:hypothetical protein